MKRINISLGHNYLKYTLAHIIPTYAIPTIRVAKAALVEAANMKIGNYKILLFNINNPNFSYQIGQTNNISLWLTIDFSLLPLSLMATLGCPYLSLPIIKPFTQMAQNLGPKPTTNNPSHFCESIFFLLCSNWYSKSHVHSFSGSSLWLVVYTH